MKREPRRVGRPTHQARRAPLQDYGELAQEALTNYCRTHDIAAENLPAYEYLGTIFLEKDAGGKLLTLTTPLKKTLFKLFDGLSNYFAHANPRQEELIQTTVAAARRMIVTEALVMGLDMHPAIDLKGSDKARNALREGAVKTLRVILPDEIVLPPLSLGLRAALNDCLSGSKRDHAAAFAAFRKLPPDLLNELAQATGSSVDDLQQIIDHPNEETISLLQNLAKTVNMPLQNMITDEIIQAIEQTRSSDIEARQQGLDELRTWAQQVATLYTPAIAETSKEAADAFRRGRKEQTTAVNAYQNQLMQLQEITEAALLSAESGGWRDIPLSGIEDSRDYKHLSEFSAALKDRIEAVELFRNGLESKLPAQDEILTRCQIGRDYVRARFAKSATLTHESIGIADVPQMALVQHPLIDLEPMQKALNLVALNCPNPAYKDAPPSLIFRESGIKSWKRACEKLVYDKESDWDKMKDLVRINVIFSHADTMYQFDTILREIAQESRGWPIDGPDNKNSQFRDRGVFLPPTGAMLWLAQFNTGILADGQQWSAEVKLDDLSHSKFESAHHKLFECARLLESDDGNDKRKLDIEGAASTPSRYNNFMQETQRVAALLSKTKTFNKELKDALKTMQQEAHEAAGFTDANQRIEAVTKIYHTLNDIHLAVCAYSMRKYHGKEKAAHPSMAALYTVGFEELMNKKSTALEEMIHKQAPQEICEALVKEIIRMQETFDLYGPQEGRDYTLQDKKHATALIARHRASFPQVEQARAIG